MNIQEIKKIAELMSTHELSEFKVKSDELQLCIKREKEVHVTTATPLATAPLQAHPPASAPTEATPETEKKDENTIDSPIVGTFYTSSAPDADPFVKPGDTVTPDTVVCIVEAMKVMNEIKAEKAGTIKEILAEDAQPVEYGQPLFSLS
ncbi:MAG: acetyl-CoA carboxylase biotin carboxyl carrier protein [Verrucomicrobiota bacterium]|nr:acetyl-CoA carboxylase biotin carboxyl carrier protein [Verrucomicrobiota bacterium]